VRDSLSLLDQAIAHGSGENGGAGAIKAEDVRQMLGLADRTRVIDLFEALMKGDAASALKELRDQYNSGADPAVVIADLAEFTHLVTRIKIVPSVADDRSLTEAERVRGRGFAAALSMRILSRTWQMLFKGLPEVQGADKAIAAAEMVLVRIAYAADLPTPDEVIRSLTSDGGDPPPPSGGRMTAAPSNGNGSGVSMRMDSPRGGAPRAALAQPMRAPQADDQTAPARAINRFEELLALAAEMRDIQTKIVLERDVRLVRIEDGQLDIALEPSASKTVISDLGRKLSQWTGRRWMVVVSTEQGQANVKSQNDARRAEAESGVRADPLVQAVLQKFPGAEIVKVRTKESEPDYNYDSRRDLPSDDGEPPRDEDEPPFEEGR
jgi:DNA polymerase-3 subunit gamma/tau